MHVVYLCNEYPPSKGGGVGTFTRNLGRELVKCGHQVTVIGYYRVEAEAVEQDEGVRVIRFPALYVPGINPFLNAPRLRSRLTRLHQGSPIDILEGPELSQWGMNRAVPGKKVIRMHGGHHFFSVTLGRKPRWLRGWIEKTSFRNADALCAVSNYVAEVTRRELRLGSRPVALLSNPVNTRQFSPQAGIAEEPGRIFFAGTLCEKKGIRQLVEAMPLICAAVPHAQLFVAGKDSIDSGTRQSYQGRLMAAISPELRERIHFLGIIPNANLPDYIARAQVCVYPSHMEAMPLTWLEGMSMGKCVVASQTGPGPEVIHDGIDGLLCDPHNPQSIASQVVRALQDAELRARLGAAARKKVEEQFSTEVMVQRNITFYQDCLEH